MKKSGSFPHFFFILNYIDTCVDSAVVAALIVAVFNLLVVELIT